MAEKKLQVDLLIFDLDGTVVDTLQDLTNAANYALSQVGRKPLDSQTVQKFIGDGVKRFLERALNKPTDQQLEMSMNHFREFYAEHFVDYSKLYPGMASILAHFKEKKRAVLTNKPEIYAVPILEKLEVARYFQLIVGQNSDLRLKPDPDGILKILSQLNVPPQRAVIIGDSENDILAGQKASVRTCAVYYGFRSPGELNHLKPDFEIEHPQQLKEIFS